MSDPGQPHDPEPSQRGFARLFDFARRRDKEDLEPSGPNGSAQARPFDMRLRLSEFEGSVVRDVMIPRADIIAVEATTRFEELLERFAEDVHSRMPVYRDTLDNPIGFVHIKDVVAEIARNGEPGPAPLERLKRDILFVPASMPLTDLLVKMQSTRIHMALVVDEYGGTDGLVSLEDLVEQIVGEIEDEHDENDAQFIRRGGTVFEVDARMEIDDFRHETGLDLSLPDYGDEIDTLGGVAFALAGRVPVRGEVLQHPDGTDVEIMEADSRRIRRLRVRMAGPAMTAQPA